CRDCADRSVQAAGDQCRHEPRTAGGRRHRRPPARAPGAALDRRYQFHVGGRQRPRVAGGAGGDGEAAAADLRAAGEGRRLTLRTPRTQNGQLQYDLCDLRGPCVDRRMILELTPEQESFKQSIEQFAREVVAPRARAIDESGAFPLDVLRAAAARGLLGVAVSSEWGGAGRDYVSYALAIEAIARASATVAVALSVTNSLVAELIAHAGRGPHKERWLRRLARGEAIGAFALSEADAGTDAANQQTRADRTGTGYRLTGRK